MNLVLAPEFHELSVHVQHYQFVNFVVTQRNISITHDLWVGCVGRVVLQYPWNRQQNVSTHVIIMWMVEKRKQTDTVTITENLTHEQTWLDWELIRSQKLEASREPIEPLEVETIFGR